MKKLMLIAIGCISIPMIVNANDDYNAHLAISLVNNSAQIYAASQMNNRLVPSAKNFLRHIYDLDKINPNFIKLSSVRQDIPYYISILADHINLLEEKISSGKTGLTSFSMVKALFTSVLSALSGYGFYYLLKNKNHLYTFTGRRMHAESLVGCGFLTVIFGTLALNFFNKVRTYKERLAKRLERDKRLLAAFEKESADISKNHVIDAALKLIDAVSAAIEVPQH